MEDQKITTDYSLLNSITTKYIFARRGHRLISTVELDACIEIFKKHATSSGHSAKLNKAAFTTLIPTDNVSEVDKN